MYGIKNMIFNKSERFNIILDSLEAMKRTAELLKEEIDERETPAVYSFGGERNRFLLNDCKKMLAFVKQEILKEIKIFNNKKKVKK